MKCPQCSNEMIRARATDFGPEYDYCRDCKMELSEMQTYTQEYLVLKADYPECLPAAVQKIRDRLRRMMSMDDSDVIPCPPNCGGCSCHINPPCSHCTDAHGQSRSDLGLAPGDYL